jgi:hypothetical protein
MSKNQELANAREMHEATASAIVAVQTAADTHRRLTHSKHKEKTFRIALDSLDLQLTGDRATLTRLMSTGK